MDLVQCQLCNAQVPVVTSRCWNDVAGFDHVWLKEVSELNLLIKVNKLKVIVLIILLSLAANCLDLVVEFQVVIGLGLHFRRLVFFLVPYHFLPAVHVVVDELVA